MKKYTTEGTSLIPRINFDFDNGALEMTGRCVPENSREFFKPLFVALETYSASAKSATNVTIQLEYFNTSSSKEILDMFRVLKKIEKNGSVVTIFWRYDEEDEEMRETGVEYQIITELTFKMVAVKDM